MIAREAGVHQTTVSLALRRDPRLRPETIERVRVAAARLGYVPDPMLTALAAYRRARRPSARHGAMAWVTQWPEREGWRCRPMFVQFFEGARRRAAELGYGLEEFWLEPGGLTARRASDILHARGVLGLILAPQPDGVTQAELDWPRFSAVAIGPTLRRPALHVVSNSQFRTVRTLCAALAERGYQKIGYAIESRIDERMDGQWSAAFDRFQRDLPAARRTRRFEQPPEREAFRAWFGRERPDVVIGCAERVAERVAEENAAPERRDAPVGFAMIGVVDGASGYAGMDENAPLVGATAAERLATLIQLGERGVPSVATRTLIDAAWVEGRTARSLAANVEDSLAIGRAVDPAPAARASNLATAARASKSRSIRAEGSALSPKRLRAPRP